MSDHLDRDTAERMLRGEDTGPPALAELLAAASAPPLRHDARGEEAAVAAFRAARSGHRVTAHGATTARRLLRPRVLAVKAALAGILLVLAGGAAVAASPHLVPSSGHHHARPVPTPAASGSTLGHPAVPVPSHAHRTRPPEQPHRHGRRHAHGHGHARHREHLAKTPPPVTGLPGRFPGKPRGVKPPGLPSGLTHHGPPRL